MARASFCFPPRLLSASARRSASAHALPGVQDCFSSGGLRGIRAGAAVHPDPSRLCDTSVAGDQVQWRHVCPLRRGWKRAIELQDAASYERTVASGDTLRVRLTWHLTEPVRLLDVFIHMVDDQETIVAKRDDEPRTGRSRRIPGCQATGIAMHNLVAPGRRARNVPCAHRDVESSRRRTAEVYNERGRLSGDLIEAGEVVITAAQPTTQ